MLGCKDSIPPTCSFPGSYPDHTSCEMLNAAEGCENEWSEYPSCNEYPHYTSGLVKDYCKVTCGNCDSK